MSETTIRIGRLVGCVLVSLFLVASRVLAQPPAQAQDEFTLAKPGDIVHENLPATPFVFWAYAFVWIALLVYVFLLWRRLTRVERELVQLTAKVKRQ